MKGKSTNKGDRRRVDVHVIKEKIDMKIFIIKIIIMYFNK